MIAQFERFSIAMTKAQALSASHQGRCDEDVKELCQHPEIKRQLKRISDQDLRQELWEHGAWEDSELRDRSDNEERIIWIAACDIRESCYEKDQQKRKDA